MHFPCHHKKYLKDMYTTVKTQWIKTFLGETGIICGQEFVADEEYLAAPDVWCHCLDSC